MNYREALEFIGEVRAGVSWERFCIHAVRLSDALVDLLSGTEEAKAFLSSKDIGRDYVSENIRNILGRLHFNPENDHYLTLALPHSASGPQIHERWKELILIYHPDRDSDERSARCAARINEAYSVLKSPEKKAEYDRKARVQREGRLKVKKMTAPQAPRREEHFIISPKTRGRLSRLIIPLCLLISLFTLLVIFLENRQAPGLYQGPQADKEDGAAERTGNPAREAGAGRPEDNALTQAGANNAVGYGEKPPGKKERRLRDRDFGGGGAPASGTAKPLVPGGPEPLEVTPVEKADAAAENKGRVFSGLSALSTPEDDTRGSEVPATGARELKKPYDVPREVRNEKTAASAQPHQVPAESDSVSIGKGVDLFLEQYVHAYEEGDIEKFMSLFSKSAMENNRMNYDEIKRAYRKNFENARYRYALGNVQFRKNGESVVVDGAYSIRKFMQNGEEATVRGDIRWVLAKEGGTFRIRKVDYESR